MTTIFRTNNEVPQSFAVLAAELKQLELAYVELVRENQRLRGNTNRPKLTATEVVRLRTLWDHGQYSQRDLADMFDINPATVSRIVRREYHRE